MSKEYSKDASQRVSGPLVIQLLQAYNDEGLNSC